ncbi:MAG TPA: prolyl oligopeptidase family serine peptidase [Agriterribacter sp.]|nr:prolyl oligopeptidase family serine peptidase [Agriterribacter sp.]
MKNKRRKFLKLSGLAGLGIAGSGFLKGFASPVLPVEQSPFQFSNTDKMHGSTNHNPDDKNISLIGLYGAWAAGLTEKQLPAFSFRKKEWGNIDVWRKAARDRLKERLAIPVIGGMPNILVRKIHEYDGLHIEEISWQLPYGRPTEAIVLKPANAKGPLPGILAFHDHGGNKYFGTRKITRTSETQHPSIIEHQKEYYEGLAWANEVAKRGYVVLVSDAFPFASRRVMLQDVPAHLRGKLNDDDPERPENIEAYNQWAGEHEHVMAKSLFSAGTTWPGVFFAEDQKALDVLCARKDVDASRIGCAGLSGGGMRTAFMGGLDERIKCAVCVGFMTTWKNFLLHKSFTHTWMTYVPLLPNDLDFPEILGLRAPLPTLVLNDSEDQLYTLPEMKQADRILQEVFTKAGARDRYQCSYYPGVHKFDRQMQSEAFGWFDKWLKA